ncbi:ABC transporter ATP-binding protein [Pseudonocardia sp.]|uniref:ABC transporter ATP-binding protein n=1 Tax=Pseudonocardia sp. TaxID=60912 RepID=UPI003D13938C
MRGPTTLLDVRDVTVRFGDLTVLDNVRMEVGLGEIVGLIGSNGSGKSSLLNVASGYYQPSEGEALISGMSTSHLSPEGVARLGVGRSFQNIGSLQELTAGEYMMLGLETDWAVGLAPALLSLRSSRRAERAAREIVRGWAERAGVVDYVGVPLKHCPYGVRKIADIVRAVIAGPTLLLLDEPTSGVASGDRAMIADLIRMLVEGSDRSIVVVDHDVEFVSSLATSMVALAAGRVIARGATTEVLADRAVVDTFIGHASEGLVDRIAPGDHS